MEIKTGYFAKAKQYADDGYALVSIAKVAPWFLPKDVVLNSLSELAPTKEILALKDNPVEYEKRYRAEILSNLTCSRIYQRLAGIANKMHIGKIVLLCYESPNKFCHRHIVAKWLGDFLGKNISEVVVSPKIERSLFDSDV